MQTLHEGIPALNTGDIPFIYYLKDRWVSAKKNITIQGEMGVGLKFHPLS